MTTISSSEYDFRSDSSGVYFPSSQFAAVRNDNQKTVNDPVWGYNINLETQLVKIIDTPYFQVRFTPSLHCSRSGITLSISLLELEELPYPIRFPHDTNLSPHLHALFFILYTYHNSVCVT